MLLISLDRLHVCTLFTDLQHYKLLLSRRVLESICWLSTFAKTLKTNRVLMSATHLKNPRFWVPYLGVPIFSLLLAFCFGEHTQWYKVKSWVDSFTQITVFCHPNLELLPLFTRVWERSNYNPGQTSLGQYCEYFFCVAFTPEEGHNTLLQGWAKKESSFLRYSSHWRDALFVSTRRFYYRCYFRELQNWRDLKVFHFCTSQPTVELVLVSLRRWSITSKWPGMILLLQRRSDK